jgi:hypothetical protein
MKKIVTRRGKLESKISVILTGLANPELEVGKILDAVDDFESANLATIDKLKKKKQVDSKRINGALKQTINAHGPITKLLIGSASKRIYGSMLTDEQEKEKISIKGFLYGIGLSVIINVIWALIV